MVAFIGSLLPANLSSPVRRHTDTAVAPTHVTARLLATHTLVPCFTEIRAHNQEEITSTATVEANTTSRSRRPSSESPPRHPVVPPPDGNNPCLLKPFFRMALTHCCQTSLLSVDFPAFACWPSLSSRTARTHASCAGHHNTRKTPRVFQLESVSSERERPLRELRPTACGNSACVQTT
ncbi:hypothetical protein E2C01_029931 [Portunus trituberculatus]|uniref:Uncharacterized protein n=1 Tax=Portunus trituberculatus TaxID=210409 RepID=A0A5B7EQP0_PORTR|nr:hypothetical protein [Portunus trituberculatus]